MTTKTIDSPHKTLEALDELVESAEKIRRKCRNKDFNAYYIITDIIHEINSAQEKVEDSIPRWERVMNEWEEGMEELVGKANLTDF